MDLINVVLHVQDIPLAIKFVILLALQQVISTYKSMKRSAEVIVEIITFLNLEFNVLILALM